MFFLNSQNTLNVLQITDTHLSSNPEGHLLGMNTFHSLCCVLDLVKQSDHKPDLIVVTGDISQDGTEQSYQLLKSSLSTFQCPSFWLPGNHDNEQNMALTIGSGLESEKLIRSQNWQIVLLNSRVAKAVHGELSPSELNFLEGILNDAPTLNTLICFHHHPVEISCKWMEQIGLRNSESLFDLINEHKQVQALLWGHVHQEFDVHSKGIRLLSSPSTCVQFSPNSDTFAIDCKAPGYRWLKLYPNGKIDTVVMRASHIEFEVDYSVKGY